MGLECYGLGGGAGHSCVVCTVKKFSIVKKKTYLGLETCTHLKPCLQLLLLLSGLLAAMAFEVVVDPF